MNRHSQFRHTAKHKSNVSSTANANFWRETQTTANAVGAGQNLGKSAFHLLLSLPPITFAFKTLTNPEPQTRKQTLAFANPPAEGWLANKKTKETDSNSSNAHKSGMAPLPEPMVENQLSYPASGHSTRNTRISITVTQTQAHSV